MLLLSGGVGGGYLESWLDLGTRLYGTVLVLSTVSSLCNRQAPCQDTVGLDFPYRLCYNVAASMQEVSCPVGSVGLV